MMHDKLNLPREKIDSAREMAKNICAPVLDFIDVHTTVTVERATLRLLGADGVSSGGVPVPNLIVDALGDRLGEGAAIWYSNALLQTGLDQSELDKRIAQGFNIASLPMGDRARAQEYATRLAQRQLPASTRTAPNREARLEEYRGNSHSPLLYPSSRRATSRDVKQAQAAALAERTSSPSYGRPRRAFSTMCPPAPRPKALAAPMPLRKISASCAGPRRGDGAREALYLSDQLRLRLCMPEIAAMGALERST